MQDRDDTENRSTDVPFTPSPLESVEANFSQNVQQIFSELLKICLKNEEGEMRAPPFQEVILYNETRQRKLQVCERSGLVFALNGHKVKAKIFVS